MRAAQLKPEDWQKVDEGLRLPFLDKFNPDLHEGLLFYWLAWNVLHPGRHRSMGGPSGIALSQIIAYMDEYGVRGRDDRDRFIELIQRMDGTFRNRVDEEMRDKTKMGGDDA